ncbi:helix-turn-helix transcriptional regulator [Streptomyces sp. Rer75]|uniref:helix-turn-helix domain-containing protein n=1 Tax=Streptomyces sp. Rer75 TaxID=2750011 RepID=UPI0015CFFC9E|nr:helix-turn-helix transcriptional regulator [Streptomyces sp. Rer75]QLH19329.1 helix-turn-helix domain-containing protein [Streptomyces sp. Rer75]
MSADHPDRPLTAGALPLPRQGEKPVAAGKVLGAYLRRLRREQGLAIKDAAPVIRASVSKISRMERGENPPRERDVLDLVDHYGVQDPKQVEAVRELLRQATAKAWYDEYADVTPGWLKRLIGLEDSATEIRTYEVSVVPGLLQTPSYARAIVTSGLPNASETEVRRRVDLRMTRQRLLQGGGRPQLVALLDEAILRRPVGSADVMVEQLEYLLHAAERSGITIRVVRFMKGAKIAPSTPVTYLKFAPGGPSELVYLEQAAGATYISKKSGVESYRYVLSELWGAAASRKETMELLHAAIREYAAHAFRQRS